MGTQASRRVTKITARVGNQFVTTVGPNPAQNAPHASFSGGVSLPARMVRDQVSTFHAVAKDIQTPPTTTALSPSDAASIANGGIPVAHADVEAGGDQTPVTGSVTNAGTEAPPTNYTPFILALVLFVLVVKI